jgi:light-regulated signal transduction histidine kinase (bacteriophytochrome)
MPTEDNSSRADRLLRKMHPVYSHDLPNQMVALQSFLQMLERDEADRLGALGRDYLGRLHKVCDKVVGMVTYLREIGRLNTYKQRVETIALASLVREIQVEVQEQLPGAPLECELAGDVPAVSADRRLLRGAIVEIVRCLRARRSAGRCRLRVLGRRAPAALELAGEMSWSADSTGLSRDRTRLEQTLEIMLAQEWLAAWGSQLVDVSEIADQSRFTIHVPQ